MMPRRWCRERELNPTGELWHLSKTYLIDTFPNVPGPVNVKRFGSWEIFDTADKPCDPYALNRSAKPWTYKKFPQGFPSNFKKVSARSFVL